MSDAYVPGSWSKRRGSPLDEPELRGEALELIREGASQNEVARRLGCTDRTVLRWLQRDGEANHVYHSVKVTRRRLERVGQAPSAHGTVRRYRKYACRCRPCTDENTRVCLAYRRRRRARERAA